MFCESYNKTHPEKQIKYDENNEYGYKVKWQNDESYKNGISGLDTTEYSNLYIIDSTTNVYGYWLGSPSGYSINAMMYVTYSGIVNINNYNNINAFRPLVCLKSTTQLRKVVDGYQIVR